MKVAAALLQNAAKVTILVATTVDTQKKSLWVQAVGPRVDTPEKRIFSRELVGTLWFGRFHPESVTQRVDLEQTPEFLENAPKVTVPPRREERQCLPYVS